jgi:hypothetical protein
VAAPVSVAALPVSVAALVSVALADAHFMYIADAHFLDAASAAVAVAAEAAAVGAAELAGYGHPPGAGSTPAGPNLHRLVKKLASRRSRSLKQGWPRERSNESHCQSSSTSRCGRAHHFLPSSSGSLAIFAAIRRASLHSAA